MVPGMDEDTPWEMKVPELYLTPEGWHLEKQVDYSHGGFYLWFNQEKVLFLAKGTNS